MENMVKKLDYSSSKKTSQETSGELNRVRMGLNIAERNLLYPEISRTISPSLINKFIKKLEEEESE